MWGWKSIDGAADRAEIASHSEVRDLMTHLPQAREDVVLHLPGSLLDVHAGNVLRRHHVVVHHGEDPELLHRAKRYRPL